MRNTSLTKLLIFILVLGIGLPAMAQRTVTGVVSDIMSGETLPGASIVVQNTNVGATTDVDGNFSIQVPDAYNLLEVNFMGFLPEVINVEGREHVEIFLSPTIEQLQEFVVTALGIQRETKALGYSVQQVSGDDLSNASRISPLSGLVGQVAGLQIGESGSGAGGSSRILIRGANSLTGSNDPLFVVDGIPIDNSGGVSGGDFGGFDYGNAINNINLDDVESISVLKGGAASALYGARGQNGVIMITTKSGTQKEGIGITYQSMVSTQTPLIKPNFQNQYSQGSGGVFGRTTQLSWGQKMQGQEVTNFLGQTQVLSPGSHPYDDFFSPAVNMDHTLTLDKRGRDNGILFSASWNNNQGIVSTNELDKKSFNLRYDSKLSDFMTLDARANYMIHEAHNRPNLAGSPDNPIYLMTLMPASVNMQQLENYQTLTGLPVVWRSRYTVLPNGDIILDQNNPDFAASPLLQNPYWATELNTNQDTRNRLLGFAGLNFDIRELLDLNFDLDLNLRAGMDRYTDERQRITAHNTYYKPGGSASGTFSRSEIFEGNYDFLLSGGNQWGDFTMRASAGGNIMQRQYRGITSSSESGLINIYGPYVIQNLNNPITAQGITDIEIHSLYGLISTDYRRMVYLDVTFRNDWTSVLASEYRSYQYPSVSATWLLEETFDLPNYVNMLKLRGSYAGVGSAGNVAGQRYFQYGTSANQFHGLPYGFLNATRPEPNLQSEYTISREVGIESILMENRFRADVSLYQTGTRDQIFRNPLAPSSGYNSGYVNAGYVNNTGVEFFSSYRIIDQTDLRWSTGINFTRQWSKVEELGEEIDMILQGGGGGVRIVAQMGHPAGIITGTAFDRDEQGRILLDNNSLPIIKTNEDGATDINNILGNANPDILWGINSRLEYKGLFFSFHIDSKMGHDLFSVTNMMGAGYGTLAFTEEGRDEWARALEVSQITGVAPNNGFMVNGVKDGVEGEYPVDPQAYWTRVSGISEAFIYDASYIRLRQISIGYNLNRRVLNATPFREASISVFANNVLYFMRNTENISPESAFGTGNNPGFEMYAYPELRSIGVNLKLSL